MRGWRGVFAGALALIALEVVVSTEDAAKRTSNAFGLLTNVVQRALSPAVPLVPERAISPEGPPATAASYYAPHRPQPARTPAVVQV